MPEQFQCPEDGCGFVVRADEYEAAIEQGREHLEEKHGRSPDESTLEEHVASVSST